MADEAVPAAMQADRLPPPDRDRLAPVRGSTLIQTGRPGPGASGPGSSSSAHAPQHEQTGCEQHSDEQSDAERAQGRNWLLGRAAGR